MINKPDNSPGYGGFYVTTDWMVRIFGLRGDELIIYAIIYSFSKDGKGVFSGSLSYLMFWTGKSKKTVIKNLKNLMERKLIDRQRIYYTHIRQDRYYCKYWTTFSRLTATEQKNLLYQKI